MIVLSYTYLTGLFQRLWDLMCWKSFQWVHLRVARRHSQGYKLVPEVIVLGTSNLCCISVSFLVYGYYIWGFCSISLFLSGYYFAFINILFNLWLWVPNLTSFHLFQNLSVRTMVLSTNFSTTRLSELLFFILVICNHC